MSRRIGSRSFRIRRSPGRVHLGAVVVVALLVAAGFAVGEEGIPTFSHPESCAQTLVGPYCAQTNNTWANEVPGEPAESGDGFYSEVDASPLPTADTPDVSSTDIWWGLPAGSTESGGGSAQFEGEVWHQLDTIGTWGFDHHVLQTWSWLRAETDTYPEYGEEGSATATASASIHDDLSGNSDTASVTCSGQGGFDELVDRQLTTTPAYTELGIKNGWMWNTLSGRTVGTAETVWEGSATAKALAFASGPLVYYTCNWSHKCK